MPFEIEIKAWVDDREAVERKIDLLAVFYGEFDKQDVYWFPISRNGAENGNALPSSGVRIRRETLRIPGKDAETTTLVTYKTKEVRDGIEINNEMEFTVDRARVFEELLRRLGLKPGISKKKRGRSWKSGGMTIEVSEIEGLGCFIELEIIAGDDSPETTATAKNRLYAFLKQTGINEDRIETRYYNDMLQDRKTVFH
ncbi:MAG: class IV adenylate cyclase [Spirochaetaceae bacterium]|jgi:adenylate cyclase class 2|nr:class IV adenylate cyclase [Spirochaetaceae bacterium]